MIRWLCALLFWPAALFAQDIATIERQLQAIGINPGVIDGRSDAAYTFAIQDFQYGFGFVATGRMTGQELAVLARAAQVAAYTTPFVIEEVHPNPGDKNRVFIGFDAPNFERIVYANGAHYLAERGAPLYVQDNQVLPSSETRKLYASGNDRAAVWRKQAVAAATASGDPLAQALVPLLEWAKTPEELPQTARALEVILESAKVNPTEIALLARLATVTSHQLRRGEEGCASQAMSRISNVYRQALELGKANGAGPMIRARIASHALACAPDALRNGVYAEWLQAAQQITPKAVTNVLLSWASDAARRGSDDLARDLYRKVADRYLAGVPAYNLQDRMEDGAMDAANTEAMLRLGMQLEVIRLNGLRIGLLPALRQSPEDSRAALGRYQNFAEETGRLLLRAGQFDQLKQISARDRDTNWQQSLLTANPDAAHFRTPDWQWQIGIDMLRNQWGEKARLQGELARIMIPQMIRDGAIEQAINATEIEAQAALVLGRFEDAEAALVRIAALAQSVGASARIAPRMTDIRRALNLSKLDSLPPADRLLGQLDLYYSEACQSLEKAERMHWDFPVIDYEALTSDPSVARALVDTDAMNKLLSCNFPQRLNRYEIRFVCAVAGFSGRADVADYLLNGTWDARKQWDDGFFAEACLHGLHLAGRPDLVQIKRLPVKDAPAERRLRFLALPPSARQSAIQAADFAWLEENDWGVNRITPDFLEKDLPLERRKELLKDFQIDFHGGFGNMGPSKAELQEMADSAIVFREMGLFRTAEAYLSIEQILDPYEFGTEDAATLDAELFKPAYLDLRLRYARLYRAANAPARAMAAIGPIVEEAIKWLGSDDDPLPGTAEQWATRLEPLFAAYLELQFERTDGPNYPAMFAIQQYLQLANSTASESVLAQRLNSADPALARRYQDARRALRSALQSGDEGVSISALNQRLQAVEAQLPQADAAFSSHQIGVTTPLREVIAGLKDEGAAMLVATQLSDAVVLMYLNGDGATARKLPMTEVQSENLVAQFRVGLTQGGPADDRFDYGLAERIYAELIGWGHVGKPAPDRLSLVLGGSLTTLPIAALRRNGKWLGAETALRLSPSVARAKNPLRDGGAFRGFIGLGDPNLTKGDTARRAALLGQGAYLAELPETANELTFMAISFGSNPSKDVFTRENASERQISALNAADRLSEISVLALATHGLLSRETGELGAAGLVLSLPEDSSEDGILTAPEIYRLRIGADLVLLSACNTGTPGAGAGLSDLASAFLYAGAGALMLTHWEIDSGAGVEIMKRIAIDQRAEGARDYAASLREAVAGMLTDEGLGKYHHPRFWASHFVLG